VLAVRALGGAAAALTPLGRGVSVTSGPLGPFAPSASSTRSTSSNVHVVSELFEGCTGKCFNKRIGRIFWAWNVFVVQLLCVAKMSDLVSAPVDVLALGAFGCTVREVLLLCSNRRLVVAHQHFARFAHLQWCNEEPPACRWLTAPLNP
jgi:hypothetical protein